MLTCLFRHRWVDAWDDIEGDIRTCSRCQKSQRWFVPDLACDGPGWWIGRMSPAHRAFCEANR